MKEDRRTRKTKKAIKDEVLRQMQTRSYGELTVTGICDALDISRRTFYLHYLDMADVFHHIFEEVNETLYEEFEALKARMEARPGLEQDPGVVKEIFQIINDTIVRNQPYLRRIAMDDSYSWVLSLHVNLMKAMIKQYLVRTRLDSVLQDIYLDYYVAGVLELYFQWYRGAISLSLDEIRDFAFEVLQADLRHVDELSRLAV